jgi:hypothetical protein
MLSEIYTWFPTGLESKELQEAKALLNKLSQSSSEPVTLYKKEESL